MGGQVRERRVRPRRARARSRRRRAAGRVGPRRRPRRRAGRAQTPSSWSIGSTWCRQPTVEVVAQGPVHAGDARPAGPRRRCPPAGRGGARPECDGVAVRGRRRPRAPRARGRTRPRRGRRQRGGPASSGRRGGGRPGPSGSRTARCARDGGRGDRPSARVPGRDQRRALPTWTTLTNSENGPRPPCLPAGLARGGGRPS